MNAHTTTDTAAIAPIRFGDRPDAEIVGLLQELIDACPAPSQPDPELSDVERSRAIVGTSAARLQALLDRAAGGKDLHQEIWSAKRQVVEDQNLLAGYVDIENIGDLGHRDYTLRPKCGFLAINAYRDGEDEPAFSFPYGLGRTAVLWILDAHARGYDAGHRDGGNSVRAQLTDVLRLR
jgi:hypothetical protein